MKRLFGELKETKTVVGILCFLFVVGLGVVIENQVKSKKDHFFEVRSPLSFEHEIECCTLTSKNKPPWIKSIYLVKGFYFSSNVKILENPINLVDIEFPFVFCKKANSDTLRIVTKTDTLLEIINPI